MGDITRDRVQVRVLEAKDLPFFEGTTNPYVEIHCGEEVRRTKMISGKVDPVFNDESLMVFTGIAHQGIEYIICKVFHKDMATFSDYPLGYAPVAIQSALLAPGTTHDDWYSLRETKNMIVEPSGAVRIQITYLLEEIDIGEGIDEEEAEELAKRKPNALKIRVERGKNLRQPSGGTGSVDSYVTIKCNERMEETPTIRRERNPKWDYSTVFANTDPNAFLIFLVKDKSGISKSIIGQARLSMVEIASAGTEFKQWIPLFDEYWGFDPQSRGEILVTVTWVYDPSVKEKKRFTFGWGSKKNQEKKEETLIYEALHDAENEEGEAFQELTAEEREEWEKEFERREKEQMYEAEVLQEKLEKIKPGDYQLQVHLIEARDLKAEDLSGTSDPKIVVECLGKKKHSRVIKSTLNPVFDEVLFFNFVGLTREQVNEAVIKISCYDWDQIGRDDLIGLSQLDFLSVYLRPDHELYRQWLPLIDPLEEDDVGIQGKLKLSVTILGPDDKQKVHDLEKEFKEEMEKDVNIEGISTDLPGVMGTIPQALNFLVVSIFSAFDIHCPDSLSLGRPSLDAYFRVDFAGNTKIKTKTVCVKGKGGHHLDFSQELWIPVMVPTFTKKIILSLWDKGITNDELLATAYFDFDEVIIKRTKPPTKTVFGSWITKGYYGPSPTWINLYGAPLDSRRGKYTKLMNTYPDLASHYRGRVLIGLRKETRPDPSLGSNSQVIDIDSDSIDEAKLSPETTDYTFRMLLLQGSEIPQFKFPTTTGLAKMKVKVCIGSYSMDFAFQPNRKGIVDWEQLQELTSLQFPKDLSQIPKIFLYLCRGPELSGASVCFAKLDPVTLSIQKFHSSPKWISLTADRSRTGTYKGIQHEVMFPGSLLLRMGFGPDDFARRVKWDDSVLKLQDKKPFCLRIFIFQCRGLPPADENGLLDPYVKVRFNGQKRKTSVQETTLDPTYYEVIEYHDILPQDQTLSPEIILQIWDRDIVSANEQVCSKRFSLTEASTSESVHTNAPRPHWVKLQGTNGEDGDYGEILISFLLIAKADPTEKIPPPLSIKPELKKCFLELITLGVRDLQHHWLQRIHLPFVQFDLNIPDERISFNSTPSREPSPLNPNFVKRYVKVLDLPVDPLFAPRLNIQVKDKRIGGAANYVIGVSTIELTTKLPWNGAQYIPPQCQLFNPDEIKPNQIQLGEEKNEEKRKKKKNIEADDDEEEDEEEKNDTENPDEVINPMHEDQETKDQSQNKIASTGDTGIGAFQASAQIPDLAPIEEDANFSQIKLTEQPKTQSLIAREKTWFELLQSELEGPVGETEDIPLSQLDIEFPETWTASEYLEGRDWWLKQPDGGSEIEEYLKTMAFETYTLYRGVYRGKKSFFSNTSRHAVGIFKGIISISEEEPNRQESKFINMNHLKVAKDYLARLYVIKAMRLQPKDFNGKADPYLQIKLGNTKIDDRENALKKTLDPDFYKMFEFRVTIPGESRLNIKIKDWNRFAKDEAIGYTIIDLEDRWFSKKWHEIGQDHPSRTIKGPPKPVENRMLWTKNSSTAQGQIQLWLEIFTEKESRQYPAEKLEPPPIKKFELRVIIWKCRNVVSMDSFSGLNDLFAKVWVETNSKKRLETDTHWRAKNGTGVWNYRLKFAVELPIKTPEQASLKLQLWDRDILKYNDIIAETSLDLYPWLKLAYHRDASLKIYKEKKDAIQRLKQKKSEEERLLSFETNNTDEEKKENQQVEIDEVDVEDEDIDDVEKTEDNLEKALLDPENEMQDFNEEPEEDESARLLQQTPQPQQNVTKVDESADVANQIKELLGIGIIPDDAEWLQLRKHDTAKGAFMHMGDIALSIEIIPWEIAEAQPVGSGRSEPNQNPFLPPPTGRMQFSANPFRIAYDLVGPAGCLKITLCCLCIATCIGVAIIGQYITVLKALF